jgi:hypothetical protein
MALIVSYTGAFENVRVERHPDRAAALAALRDADRYEFVVERDDDLLGFALERTGYTLTGAGCAQIYNVFADQPVEGRFTNRTAGAKRTARMLLAKFAGAPEPNMVPEREVVIGLPSNTFEPPAPENLDKPIKDEQFEQVAVMAAQPQEDKMIEYKLGEFKQVRANSLLGKIIASVQLGNKDLDAVAADVDLDADTVEQRLKVARRTHGIDYVFSDPDEHISLVVPPGSGEILKFPAVKAEKKAREFNPPKLGRFTPVRSGTNLAAVIASIAAGGRTLNSLAAEHGTDRQKMNGILRHGLAIMHGIGHVIDVNGIIALTDEDPTTLIKPPPAPRASVPPSGQRVQLKTKELNEAAARGEPPAHLVITSAANAHRQKHVDKLEKMAADGDWEGVHSFHMKGIDSYSAMINRHRDRILAAHEAQTQRQAAE